MRRPDSQTGIQVVELSLSHAGQGIDPRAPLAVPRPVLAMGHAGSHGVRDDERRAPRVDPRARVGAREGKREFERVLTASTLSFQDACELETIYDSGLRPTRPLGG